MLNYKGYIGHVEFDDEAETFHGEIINTRDIITFQGNTPEELKQELKNSIDVYLEYCRKKNRDPEKPFSGNFLVRSDPNKHRDFMIAAKKNGMSLNRWVNDVLDNAAHQV